MKPRVFVSVPEDRHLDKRRWRLKRAVIGAVANEGFDLVGFEPEQFGMDAPVNPEAWSVDRAKALLQKCDGMLILALARTWVQDARVLKPLPTPYNHLEGALAISMGIPILIVFESGMDRDGIFYNGIKSAEIPADASELWASSPEFRAHLPVWANRIRDRRDIFLGYCSKGSVVAENLRQFLEESQFTVLDWSRDFKPGSIILEEIERAALRCRAAVFIFTKDDELTKRARGEASFAAIPRDNVLLEAGYFMYARGKSRVAIVFSDRNTLSDTRDGLRRFLGMALSSDEALGERL